jgi:hypothetical protein
MTVLSLWMQDGFSYCHSNSIFWEQLLDLPARQYHYGGASPTDIGDFQLMLLYTKFWGAENLSHAQDHTCNVLDLALKSHEHLSTSERQH